MAGRETAARRYAEAAFEIALRDENVDTWRSELEGAADALGDERVSRMLSNPAIALEQREALVEKALSKAVSRHVLNLILLMLKRRRIDQLPRVAAEFRRLDNQRKGITQARATSAAELTPAEVEALTEQTRTTHRWSRRARRVGRSQPAGRPRRARRRPAHRRERPGPPRAAAEPARLGRPLGDSIHGHPIRRDHQHHQVRDRPVRCDDRDAQRRNRGRGRRRHRPDLRARRRAGVGDARVPGRGHGPGAQPRRGDGRRGHPR